MGAESKRDASKGELDLEIRQNDKFQQREWRVERVGWVLLALFILAGVLGFLGPGLLSLVTAESEAGTVQVEYQRVTHNEADDSATLIFSPGAIEDGKVTLELTGSWEGSVDISSISPAPSTEYAVPGGVAMEFDVLQPGELEVTILFRAMKFGPLNGEAAVGEDTASFSQFVLP